MSKVILYETVEDHVAPHRAHEDDVGLDLTAYSIKEDKEKKYTTIDLGTRIALPGGSWAQLYARSSLADVGWRLATSVGIIDSGYRGPLKVKLEKRYDKADKLEVGQVYVQLVVYPNPFIAVKAGRVSKDTERGEGGFGSTTRKKAATIDDEETPKRASRTKKTEEDEEETPKKSSRSKKAVIEEEEETPKRASRTKKAVVEDEEEETPKKSSRAKKAVVEDDEEEAPKKSSRKKAVTEEEEETPKRASRAKKASDDEEEAPKRSSRKKAEEEETPKRASRTKTVVSDDDEPPRTSAKKKAARGKASADE